MNPIAKEPNVVLCTSRSGQPVLETNSSTSDPAQDGDLGSGRRSKGPETSRLHDQFIQTNNSGMIEAEKASAPVSDQGHPNAHSERDFNEDDDASFDSDWTESTLVPIRSLGFLQCSAFMINQMIGIGIFTTPGYVLLLVKSKPISLVLWAVGGIYSLLSVFLFLEFGTALPYNGGALIYLSEVFHRPELLAAILFSFYWIILVSNTGTCITFAQYALQLANPNTPPSDLDDRSLRFIAMVVATVATLLLYFVRRLCFFANNIFALLKIVLTLLIFGIGMRLSQRPNSGFHDFGEKQNGANVRESLTAMIYILYSYQGWEHTTYIAGEIKAPKTTMRNAALFSVGLVTVLYMMVTTAYYTFATYADITGPNLDIGIATHLAQEAFGSEIGIRVAIALSAFSNLIANLYTTAKVKQAIAWQRFIPFYKFIGHQDRQFDSPSGGLVLHWMLTVIQICATDTGTDAYSFNIGMVSYDYEILMLFLGLGLFRLAKRMRAISEYGQWTPVYLKNRVTLYGVASVFIGVNLLVLVVTAEPEESGTIPRFYWPVTIAAVLAAGTVYWAVFEALQTKFRSEQTLGQKIGFEVSVYKEGDEDIPEVMRRLMIEAGRDGSRRRVSYKISGRIERCVRSWQAGIDWVKVNMA